MLLYERLYVCCFKNNNKSAKTGDKTDTTFEMESVLHILAGLTGSSVDHQDQTQQCLQWQGLVLWASKVVTNKGFFRIFTERVLPLWITIAHPHINVTLTNEAFCTGGVTLYSAHTVQYVKLPLIWLKIWPHLRQGAKGDPVPLSSGQQSLSAQNATPPYPAECWGPKSASSISFSNAVLSGFKRRNKVQY